MCGNGMILLSTSYQHIFDICIHPSDDVQVAPTACMYDTLHIGKVRNGVLDEIPAGGAHAPVVLDLDQ
jgi:hypothetical protein